MTRRPLQLLVALLTFVVLGSISPVARGKGNGGYVQMKVEEAQARPAFKYGELTNDEAYAELDKRGVPYIKVEAASGVRAPVRLTGPLHGVDIHSSLPPEQRATSVFEILDARLALCLDDFAADLAKYDIVEVVHFTMYRPNVAQPGSDAAVAHDEPEAPAAPSPAAKAAPRKEKKAGKAKPVAKPKSLGKGARTSKRAATKARTARKQKAEPKKDAQKEAAAKKEKEAAAKKEKEAAAKKDAAAKKEKEAAAKKDAAAKKEKEAAAKKEKEAAAKKEKEAAAAAKKDAATKKKEAAAAKKDAAAAKKEAAAAKKDAKKAGTKKDAAKKPGDKKPGDKDKAAKDDDDEEEPVKVKRVSWAPPGTRHPAGLAIDVGAFRKRDGTWLRVAQHFKGRIGAAVCGVMNDAAPTTPAAELRAIVCGAVGQGLFTYGLTPNHDEEHFDHFHLELRIGALWAFVD